MKQKLGFSVITLLMMLAVIVTVGRCGSSNNNGPSYSATANGMKF